MAYVSKENKAAVLPSIKAVLKKYGIKGSVSVRNNSSLVVKVAAGPIDFGLSGSGYEQVNVYRIEQFHTGTAQQFLTELLAAMKGRDWYNRSDSSVDYFDVKYYCDINIGAFDRPYVLTAG